MEVRKRERRNEGGWLSGRVEERGGGLERS